MKTIKAGRHVLGYECPCFIAAEVGLNHNGSIELAHKLIDAAADAGVNGVKFQNYRTEDFISDRSLTYEYTSDGKSIKESQYDMFKRYEFPRNSWCELRRHCDRRGIVFFSTPSSEAGVVDMVKVGAPLLKNGSDYLTHVPIIKAMARTGLPTVISTGMATLAEIDDAVRAFRTAGGKDLILLHCTSSYPTPPEDIHLRKIPVLAAAFNCPVGLSDHSDGIVAALGGVALGACFIEKHFTLDKNQSGPDHRFSADPQELRRLIDAVRTLEKSLGGAAIGPTPSEELGRRDFRLSCAAANSLRAKHRLCADDVVFRRPGTGIAPSAVGSLLGRRLAHAVPQGKFFTAADFQ